MSSRTFTRRLVDQMIWAIMIFVLGEALISSFLGDDDNNSMADDNPVSQQFQMAKALSVLQIKASTFHSLHFSGKHDEVLPISSKFSK